jgi:SAM-dependent methyltransferase
VISLLRSIRDSFRSTRARGGLLFALRTLLTNLWDFLLDSTPSRRRQRYGDIDFDWDYRVDTTGATVGWRDRLLGVFHSAYQPTEPGFFHPMLQALEIDFPRFTFIDLGSGKGRTLLMASDYPFRRILGVELLPSLHQIAVENLKKYSSPAQRCFAIESLCEDARSFEFPLEPTVLYLFNPLPEEGLAAAMQNLADSLRAYPREVYVLYQNPVLRHVLDATPGLRYVTRDQYYLLYKSDVA